MLDKVANPSPYRFSIYLRSAEIITLSVGVVIAVLVKNYMCSLGVFYELPGYGHFDMKKYKHFMQLSATTRDYLSCLNVASCLAAAGLLLGTVYWARRMSLNLTQDIQTGSLNYFFVFVHIGLLLV